MREKMKMAGKYLLIFCAVVMLGTLLMTLAYMLPINEQNRETTYAVLNEEGSYPRALVQSFSLDKYFTSFFPDVLDNSTDSLMLSMAMDDSQPDNALVRAMKSYNTYQGMEYSYYWHGYVCVLRPLLFFFDYAELRCLNGMCQLLLVFLFVYLVGRKKGVRYALAALTSFLLLMPAAMMQSLQFTWVFYISYLGTSFLLGTGERFFQQKSRYLYFFMVIGMLTSFFDLLTYPLLTWGIPVLWWIAMTNADCKAAEHIKTVVHSAIFWVLGYAGMWVMKWILATVILGRDIVSEAIDEVFLRSGVQEGMVYDFESRLSAIYLNWKHYEYKTYFLLLTCWLIWWLWQSVRKGWKKSSKQYAYLLTGFSCMVWYFVLANHTAGHHFFTYRIFAVSILAFLMLIIESINIQQKDTIVNVRRQRIIICCVWSCAALLSLGLMRFTRENLMVTNGMCAFQRMELEENGRIEASFVPSFSQIRGFGPILECADIEGIYRVSVWDGEALKYQEDIPIEKYGNSHYYENSVKWNLVPGKEYRMTVEAVENIAPVYAYVTDNGENLLSEINRMSVNGEVVEGQPLFGIRYYCLPGARWTKVFVIMTWIGVLTVCAYVFLPLQNFSKKKESAME